MTQKKQVLCDLQVFFLIFNCQTPGILDKTAEPADEEEQQFIDSCTTIVAVPMAVDYQIAVADTYDSNCILLEKAYDEPELMENAGYQCYGRTENYVVYFRR